MKGDKEDWRRRGNQGRETWGFEGGEDDAEGKTGWEKNSPFKFNEKTDKMAVLNKVKEY